MRGTRAAVLLAILTASSIALAGEVDLPRYPSISPDGERIVFSWHGDLWTVPADGGEAHRLTNHAGLDTRSAWSPDGSTIAFESDRSGFWNLHVMAADGSDLRQVTHEDGSCSLAGFGADGTSLLFTSSREGDVYSEPRPFRVSIAGGPIRRVFDAHGRFPRENPFQRDQVLFTRGGSLWTRRHYRGAANRDVWLADGGSFLRLTSWEGNDGRARWLGTRRLVYMSDRELGTVNLWGMEAGGLQEEMASRLTSFEGRDVQSFDVAPDTGRIVLHVWDRLYVIDSIQSPRPRPLTITAPDDPADQTFVVDASSKVTEARLSPDGKVLATVAFGDVFVRALDDDSPTRRVTRDTARAKDLAWSPDGMRLYFVSDVGGDDSIYAATVERTRTEVLAAFEEATRPTPEEAPESAEPAAEEPPVDAPGDPPDENANDDGAAAGDAGDAAAPDPDEPKDEGADAAGPARWQDAVSFTVEPVLVVGTSDREPTPSPDGRWLAFRRGLGDLCVLDLGPQDPDLPEVTVASAGWNLGSFRWSPDSRHLAWHREDRDFNSDIWVARHDPDGWTPAVNVSRHPDDDVNPRWSEDGRILAFASERRDEEFDVYVVFLDRDLEAMTPQELNDYFDARKKAAKRRKPLPPPGAKPEKGAGKQKSEADAKPVELELDDAYLRVRRVTTSRGNEVTPELTPAGDRIVYSTGSELHVVGWDGKDDKKLRGAAAIQHLSLDGETVVHVAGGKAGTLKTAGGGDKTYGIAARLELDWAAFQEQRFGEAMRHLGEVFYHPTMKGLDWPGVTRDYLDLARRARTTNEFDEIANRQLGELNASHLGIRSPSPDDAPEGVPNGRLGIDVVPDETTPGAWRVTRVLRGGPADGGSMWLLVGDVITAIDGAPCDPARDFLAHLRGRTGEDVLLTIRRPRETAEPLELSLLLRAVSGGAERQLRYEDWTRRNAESVHARSNGRLGYLHIRAMSGGSLRDFERDLYAAAEGRDGLIVDVRNNGGGSTADRVLASIMVRPHAYTVPRGADPGMTDGYPQDRLFIQRYTRPMSMLCNEKSFSNAEIVSHAFKTLERGTLVGEQTYGGVISTGGYTLLDGTWVRTPFRGWYLPDGTDMENHGAVPDLRVPRTPEAESRQDDVQLRAAVDELLGRLPPR